MSDKRSRQLAKRDSNQLRSLLVILVTSHQQRSRQHCLLVWLLQKHCEYEFPSARLRRHLQPLDHDLNHQPTRMRFADQLVQSGFDPCSWLVELSAPSWHEHF